MTELRGLGAVDLRDTSGAEVRSVPLQPKRLAILVYLASAAPDFVSRDTLLGLFWPELDESRARGALNQAVSFLRRELETIGGPQIVSRGEALGIDPANLSYDVAEFRRAIAEGRFDEATSLYRGTFLEGCYADAGHAFDEWLELERTRLREQAADAACAAAQRLAQDGDVVAALAHARRAVELSATDERALRTLLELLDRAGDRASALQAYDAFARRLAAEFDAEPAAETVALMKAIRARTETNETAATAITTRVPAVIRPSTVSRAIAVAKRRARTTAVAAALTIAGSAYAWRESLPPDVDAGTIVVFPFTVRAPDSSSNYLREGLVDILAARFTGEGVPRAVDTRAVLRAYGSAARDAGRDLSTDEAIALGRRFGAGLVVLGEFVAAPGRATMSAHMLDVTTGKLVAEQTETGSPDPIALATRLTTRLMAKSIGESSTRLSALSDSVDAVKAYLAGLRSYRSGQPARAFDELSRALEIDSTFAAAALWRAYTAWGAFIFGNRPKRMADSVAWSLHDRLAARDQLILAAMPSIGPNYPAPSTAEDLARAWERAAHANPDRADVWAEWSRHLTAWGVQTRIPSRMRIAAMAADSAIALDSSFARGSSQRAMIALQESDAAGIRRYERIWYAADSTGITSAHWAMARALGDSVRANNLFEQMVRVPLASGALSNVELWSAGHDLASVEDAERLARRQLAHPAFSPAQRTGALQSMFRVEILRGQLRLALAYMDSAAGLLPMAIWASVAEPSFAPVALRAVETLSVRLDTLRDAEQRANTLCHVHLWRAQTGDTATTRAAIDEMRRLVKPLGPAPGWRVGNLGVCPLLLEAWLDRRPQTPWTSRSLDKLETILLAGPLGELPHNTAYLLAARWRAEQGDTAKALTLLRSLDPMAGMLSQPARWRLEARLAAAVGDTAGAVYAYNRFLKLRDRPEPGPLVMEVSEARRELASLERKP